MVLSTDDAGTDVAGNDNADLQQQGQQGSQEGAEDSQEAQQKAEAEAKAAEEAKKAEDSQKIDIPEQYDFSNVDLPEGFELDKSATEKFEKYVKDKNLKISQEDANGLVSMHAQQMNSILAQLQETQQKAADDYVQGLEKELREHPTMGGDNYTQTVTNAGKVFEALPALKNASDRLSEDGLGNHPAIMEILSTVGKFMGNDKFHTGGAANNEEFSAVDMFPSMQKK